MKLNRLIAVGMLSLFAACASGSVGVDADIPVPWDDNPVHIGFGVNQDGENEWSTTGAVPDGLCFEMCFTMKDGSKECFEITPDGENGGVVPTDANGDGPIRWDLDAVDCPDTDGSPASSGFKYRTHMRVPSDWYYMGGSMDVTGSYYSFTVKAQSKFEADTIAETIRAGGIGTSLDQVTLDFWLTVLPSGNDMTLTFIGDVDVTVNGVLFQNGTIAAVGDWDTETFLIPSTVIDLDNTIVSGEFFSHSYLL